MKVCISPSSLKLLSTYFNRKLPGIVTENKTYNQILTELYNEALSDFKADQISLAAEDISLEELILQHLTVAPQLISTYIANNPLLTGDFSSIKNELDENRASVIQAIQSDNTEDFKSVVQNLGSAVGSKEVQVPVQQINIARYERIKFPLYTIINNEGLKNPDGSFKPNNLDPRKEIVSKIQLKLMNSDNAANLQFKLVSKAEIIKDPAYRETLTEKEFQDAGPYVMVLTNSNGTLAKFNEQGVLDNAGVFPIFSIKTTKAAFSFQIKNYIETAKQRGQTQDEAMAAITEEVDVYLKWLKDSVKQVQAGEDVFFNVDLSRSSQGAIEYHTLLATPISQVANVNELSFEINATEKFKGAAIRLPGYNELQPLRERAFEEIISDEETDLFINLLTNNSLRYKGVTISKTDRERFIRSYMSILAHGSTSGVGFEVKFDIKGQVTGIVLAGVNYTISTTAVKDKTKVQANIEKFKTAFKQHINKWYFIPVGNNYSDPGNYTVVEGKTQQEVLNKLQNIKQGQYVKVNGVPMILMKPTVSFGLFPNTTSIENGEIYRIDSIQGNVLTVKTKPLKQHIIESTDTNIVVDASNNIRPAFPYLAFNPIMPNTEDTAPSEEIYFQSISEKSRIDDLEKGLFWSEDTLAMKWMKDRGWLSVLKLVMKDDFHAKGPQFVASFIGNTISLWKGSNNTDLYHEVFHAYFQGLLTNEERQDIYNSLRSENKGKSFTVTVQGQKKSLSFDTASKLELEEFLAEEFRKYARNESKYNKQLKSPIARFFEILKDLFNRMFGNRTYSEVVTLGFVSNKVQSVFKDLYDGQVDVSKFVAPQDNFERFQSFEFDQDIKMTNAQMQKALSTMQTLYVNYIDNVVNPLYASDEILDQATKAFIDVARIDPLSKTTEEPFKDRFNKASASFRTKYKEAAKNFSGRNSIALQRNPRLLLNALKYIEIRMDQIRKTKLKSTSITDIEDVEMLTKALEYFGDYNVITEGFDALDGDTTSLMGIFLNHFTPINLKGVEYVQDEKDINPDEWNFDKTGTEKRMEDDVDVFTKFLLSTLYHYQKSGRSNVPYMNSLGVPKLLPFKLALVKVVNATANKGTTEEEMYQALVDAAAKDFTLKQLVERLGDPSNPNISSFEIDQWGHFWRSINKADIRLLSYQLEKEDNAEKEESKFIAKVGKTHNSTNNQIKNWGFDFQNNVIEQTLDTYGLWYVDGKATYGLIPELVINKWGVPAYYVAGDENNYFTSIERKKELEAQGIKVRDKVMWKMDPIGFYKDLGIEFSYSEEVKKILLEGSDEYGIEANMTKYIYDSIANRVGAVKESQQYVPELRFLFSTFQYKQTETSKKSTPQPALTGYLEKLANLALSLDEVSMSFMEYTAYGERMSTKSLHSSLSIELSILNRTEIYDQELKAYRPVTYTDLINTAGMEHWDYVNNPEVAANLTVVKMYNLDKDPASGEFGKRNTELKITLQHLTGAKVTYEGQDKGVKSRKSDERTKFNTDFVQTLNNKQELLRAADKSSSYVTTQPIKKDNETQIRKGLWIDNLETYQIFQDDYKGTLLFDIFYGHIESEVLRIARLNKIQERIDAGETVQFDPKFLERGKDWFKFSLLLSKDVKERLLKLELEESFTIREAINEFDPTLIQAIEQDLKEYFGFRATQLHTEKDKTLTVADNIYEEYALEDEEEYDTRMRLFQVFIINNYIQNLNYGTFLGDPANYGVSNEDFHKRLAGKISTGRMMRHSQAWYNYINNSDKYERDGFSKQHFESLSEERRAELGLGNTYQKRIYNGYLQTAILKEAVSDSVYRKHYAELLGIDEKKYSEMQEADGAAYVSFDTYRLLAKSHQEWSDDQEAVYQAMLRGENINQLKTKATFPVRKYQEYGPLLNSDVANDVRLQLMSFHKYSVIPLIPTLIENTPLEQIHQMMMEQGIDYVTFQTGSKLSNVVRINQNGPIYDDPYVIRKEKSTIDGQEVEVDVRSLNRDIKFTKNTIHVRHLKSVAQQSEGYHGTVTLPSQMRKINLTGLYDENSVPKDYKGRKKWTNLSYAEKLKASENFRWAQEYISTIDDLISIARDEIVEDLGLTRVVNPTTGMIEYSGTTEKFGQYIKEQLANKQLTAEEIDFIFDKATGQVIPDLSLSLNSSKIEEVLIKLADDELRRLEVNGEPLVQVPGTMMEGVVERPRLATTNEVFQYGNNGLSTYYGLKEDGTIATSQDDLKYVKSMEVKISLQGDFKKLLYTEFKGEKIIQYQQELVLDNNNEFQTKYTVDFNASLKRLNEALLDEEWLDLYGDAITLPATRIPTSQFSMLESARVKEFLPPIAGPIVILPSEIVAKSGSDFDIDKLFTLFVNIVNINGSIELADYIPGIQESRTELLELVEQARLDREKVQDRINKLYDEKENIWKQSDKISADLKALLSKEYNVVASLRAERKALRDQAQKVYNKEGKYKNWSASKIYKYHHGENGTTAQIKELNDRIEYIRKQIKDVTEASIKALYEPINAQIEQIKNTDLKKADERIDVALRRLHGKSRKAIENKIVSLLNERITNPAMFKSLAEPNSTDMFDDIAASMATKLTKAYNKFDNRTVDDIRNNVPVQPITKDSRIANSTIFDYRYNLLKHQENFKGMDALGIAAVTSTYYALLTQFGATLNGLSAAQQTLYNDALLTVTQSLNGFEVNKNKLAQAKETLSKFSQSLTIKFPHRNVEAKISLAFLENVEGRTIQDVIGQLINGFVDVAKKPWIFNVQGNMENIPQMLLMVMAGMKVDDIVNFSSLPLVLEYNTLKEEMKGIFSNITKEYKKKPFASTDTKKVARAQMLARYQNLLIKNQLDIMPDDEYNAYMANSLSPLELMDDKYLSDRVAVDITEDNVEEHYRLLAHYFQIEDMAGDFTAFTMATKFDTQKPQSLTEYQARLDEIEKLKANTKSSIPFEWYDKLLKKDENGIYGSILGAFNNDQFIIDLFANRFAIRNNAMTIKKSLFAPRPANVDKELAYIGFKDDFGFFLYQNAFFRSQNYDGYEFIANENIQVPLDVQGDKIYFNPALVEGKILDMQTEYEQNFFPTIGHYLRYRVELEKVEKEFSEIQEYTTKDSKGNDVVVGKIAQIQSKYYYVKTTDNRQFSIKETKDKLALWRSRNNVAFFDMRMGVVTMIEAMKKKHPDLRERFQLIADLQREYTPSTKKANFYIDNLEDPLLVNTYKENLADLKNSEYPEVAELFQLFDHLAILQAGASSTGRTNMSRIIDQSKFYKTIEEEIGVAEIVKQLEEGVSQMRQGIPMKDIRVPLLDQFVEVYSQQSVPNWFQRKKGINLMVDEFEYESQGKALNNLSTMLVKAYTKFDGVEVPEPKIILENLLVDLLAEKGAELDLNSPSLDINWEFLDSVKGKPVAVINKTKFHVQDEGLQDLLNEVLMDYFGIDNTGDVIEIRPKSIGQTKDNISIAFSEEKRAKHSFVDEQMANSSNVAIGKETDQIAKPSVATYYAREIERLYPERLASKATKFKATDKVWIFGSGVFETSYAGKMSKDQWQGLVENDFNKNYKSLIDKAIKAGVNVFNVGTATGIDELALDYLKSQGFYVIPKYTLAGSYNQVIRLGATLDIADDFITPGATSVSFKDIPLSFVLDKELEKEINKHNEKSLLTGEPYLKVQASILDKLRQLKATNIQQAKYIADILIDIAGSPIVATGAVGIYRSYVERALMELRNDAIAKRKNASISVANIATVQVKQRLEFNSGMEMNFGDGAMTKDEVTDQWYSRKMMPQFKGKNTFDLSVSGDRTRTTRTGRQIQELLDIYGFRKTEELIGMVVPMTENVTDKFTKKKYELRRAYVRITKISKFTQEYQDQTWQKEGWEKYVTDALVGKYDWGVEYEFVTGGTLTNEDLKQIKPCEGG